MNFNNYVYYHNKTMALFLWWIISKTFVSYDNTEMSEYIIEPTEYQIKLWW